MKRIILSSLLASGLVVTGPAQAETMPFSELAGNVSADTLLQLPPDYFYVMDANEPDRVYRSPKSLEGRP